MSDRHSGNDGHLLGMDAPFSPHSLPCYAEHPVFPLILQRMTPWREGGEDLPPPPGRDAARPRLPEASSEPPLPGESPQGFRVTEEPRLGVTCKNSGPCTMWKGWLMGPGTWEHSPCW